MTQNNATHGCESIDQAHTRAPWHTDTGMKIVVFDSGVGGLLTLARLEKELPRAELVYVSDPQCFPYGDKPLLWVRKRVLELVLSEHADAVVIACNTATCAAAQELRARGVRTFGIEPALKPALLGGAPVCVLCTPLTAARRYAEPQGYRVVADATLAVQIERMLTGESEQTPERIVERLASALSPAVVLGCTHYGYLASALRRKGYTVYDGAEGLCSNVIRSLASLCKDGGKGGVRFVGGDHALLLARIRAGAYA